MKVKDFIKKLNAYSGGIVLYYNDDGGYTYIVESAIDGEFIKIVNDWEIKEIDLAEIANYKTFKLIISEW